MNQTTTLARMRDSLEAKLTGSFSIYALSLASDGYGGQPQTYSLRESGVSGHLEMPAKGREADVAAKLTSEQVFVLHLPSGTTVQPTDRVSDGSVTYEVLAVDAPTTLEPMRGVFVVRVQ